MDDAQHTANKKAALRRQARQYLLAQPKSTLQHWGRAMADALFCLDQWKQAKTVFCFVSTDAEPDTLPILKAVLAQGRTLCVPRTKNNRGDMDAVVIKDLQQLASGRWGILEPAQGLPLAQPEQIDLIVAPCLMAGSLGQRLGQGGGYYDRFFARCHCPKVVLCPSQLVSEQIPLEPFDQPVDFVLTEAGLLYSGI